MSLGVRTPQVVTGATASPDIPNVMPPRAGILLPAGNQSPAVPPASPVSMLLHVISPHTSRVSVSLRVIVPQISRVGMSFRVGELTAPIIPGNYVGTPPSRVRQ
jgi:hypothetical protein